MKKKFLFLFGTLLAFHLSQAQTKKYFVAFCSEEVSKSAAGGHAFITLGKGEPFTCNIDDGDGESYGLYAADFKNTMRMNMLASFCSNCAFITLLILEKY